jgi:hypothetical protein
MQLVATVTEAARRRLKAEIEAPCDSLLEGIEAGCRSPWGAAGAGVGVGAEPTAASGAVAAALAAVPVVLAAVPDPEAIIAEWRLRLGA